LTTLATVRVTAVLAAIAQPVVAKVIVSVVAVVAPPVAVHVVAPVPPVMATVGDEVHVKPGVVGNAKTIVLPPASESAPCAEVVKPTVHFEVSSPADEPGVNVTAVGAVAVYTTFAVPAVASALVETENPVSVAGAVGFVTPAMVKLAAPIARLQPVGIVNVATCEAVTSVITAALVHPVNPVPATMVAPVAGNTTPVPNVKTTFVPAPAPVMAAATVKFTVFVDVAP
jgi:hypothetical protein